MPGFLNRKSQPREGSLSRIDFPKNATEANAWPAQTVRLIRLSKEHHLTYKYGFHLFRAIPGQGPRIDGDGNAQKREGWQWAYCLGSPPDPFSQEDAIEMSDDGISACRGIVLPNGVPLHDVDEGGKIGERALVWSWTNNHLAIIDRPPKFFDRIKEWAKQSGADPFFYNRDNPGFDVMIQTAGKQGNFYDYQFSGPLQGSKNIADVMHLVNQQRGDVMKFLNPVQTREDIIERLGLGDGAGKASAPAAQDSGAGEFGDGSAPGSVSDLNDGDDEDDGLSDMGEDL